MADWIAWQKGLASKPEVALLARDLGVTRFDAAARCMVVWEWWDANSTNGFVAEMTPAMLSDLVGMPGMAESMQKHGWLDKVDGGLRMPNWERWNSRSAKKRLQDAKYQRRRRAEG